jgi:hypothetical protein
MSNRFQEEALTKEGEEALSLIKSEEDEKLNSHFSPILPNIVSWQQSRFN